MLNLDKKTNQRKDEIQKLLSSLSTAKGALGDEQFTNLCLYSEDADIDCVYNYLTNQSDTFSIYWLIKYIIQIERPYAFEKLYELSQNQNIIIRQEVQAGIKKISKIHKIDILMLLLKSSWEDNVLFSITELGDLRVPKAVFLLINILKQSNTNDEMGICIIQALGKIKDSKCISTLEEFADKKEGELQEEALCALSKFNEILDKKYILKWLRSDNIKIKEFLFLKILRQFDRKWEKYVIQGLRKKEDEHLKQSILTSVRRIQTNQLFNAIYELALNDKSYQVRMLAQALLNKLKAKKSTVWIIRKWIKADIEEKCFILRLLANYSEDSKVFTLFKNAILKSNNKRLKLIAIEYFGRLKNKNTTRLLLDIIHNDDEFDYAASIALSYLITPSNWTVVEIILTLNAEKKELCIIVFLKFILRLPSDYTIPDHIEKIIEILLNSESQHIRYMATRCLLRMTKSDKLYQFLQISLNDKSQKVKGVALENIISFLNARPQDMISFLSMCVNNTQFMPVLNKAFKRVTGHKNNYDQILRILLKLICKEIQDDRNVINFHSYRRMVLLRNHVIRQKSLFLDLLQNSHWNDKELWILMTIVNSTDIKKLGGIEIDFMANQYSHSSSRTKQEYLKFFRNMNVISEAVEKIVFNDLSRASDEVLTKDINKTVSTWLQNNSLQVKV